MCKNRLYFAVKCPFRSQNSLIIKHLHTIYPHSPFFEELTHHPAYFQNFLFFLFYFLALFLCLKNIIFCVFFYMVLGTEIGCFCRIKNQGFRLGCVRVFLRIKIWLFLRAVRLYFCMSEYLYDLCVFVAQRALFCEFIILRVVCEIWVYAVN